MGYGALSAADYFDSPGYTVNPKVKAFKWGRNGWNIATTPTYLNSNPVGSMAIATPGPFSITNQYVNTTGTCTGSTATSAGVSGLVGCVGFQTISQGASSGMANWTTTILDPSYKPVDVRTTVPSGQYIYNHTPAAYSFNIPFQSLFSSTGSYANLQTLDQTFTGGTPAKKYVFYNRSQVTGLMSGMASRMLGYDGLSMSSGLKGWNGSYGEGNLGNAVNCPGCALMTGQTTGAMYGGTITPAYTLNSGLSLAPTISGLSATSSYTGGGTANATITWTTDYPATTQINDKTTYNDTVLKTTGHSATLNGLTCGTIYTVNAISYDCVANKDSDPITFTTADCQDLYVSSVTAPISVSLSMGQPFTVGTTVNKSGSGSAGTSTARIYLYGNLNGTGNKYLKLADVTGVGPTFSSTGSQSDAISASVTIPLWVWVGTHSIVVRADLNNTVSEWNENNNRKSISITIVP